MVQYNVNTRIEVERIIGFPIPRSCEGVFKAGVETGLSISAIANSIIKALEEEE